MNRTVRCLALFAIAVGAWACKGDPNESLNRGTGTTINAFPNVVFVDNGAVQEVFVDVRDDANQAVAQNNISHTAGAGITVFRDTMFEPVFNPSGVLVPRENPTRLRYEVTGVSTVGTSFTVQSTGQSIDIPVNVVPVGLPTSSVSNTNPMLGETVIITLTGSLTFDSTTTVYTDASTTQPIVTALGSNSINFIVAPNTDNPFTVTGVTMPYASTVPAFNLTTDDNILSPLIAAVPVTVSNATPAAASIMRVTLGTGFVFDPTAAAVSFGFLGTVTEKPGYQTAIDPGNLWLEVAVPAGDGTTMIDVNVAGVRAVAAPEFSLSLPTDQDVLVGACPVGLPGTGAEIGAPVIVSPLPAAGVTVLVFDCGPTSVLADFFGFPGRWYGIDTGAGQNFDVVAEWSNTEDYGWYIDFFGPVGCVADGLGGGAGGQPEVASCAGLTPGVVGGAFISFNAGNPLDLIIFHVTGR